MSCCDKNKKPGNERAIPEGVDPCCNVRGQSCMCLPYDDPWLIAAQVLTIVSVGFAWICWVTFAVGIIGLVLFQILWCVRMRTAPLFSHMVVAGVISAANLGIAIYVLIEWKKKSWCDVFIWYTDDLFIDDDYYDYFHDDFWDDDFLSYDDCHEKIWFAISLVCSLLWAAAMFCMIWFVKSGRHAKWEKKHTATPPSNEAEITATPSKANDADADAIVANASVLEETGNETGGDDEERSAVVAADASILETEKEEDSVE